MLNAEIFPKGTTPDQEVVRGKISLVPASDGKQPKPPPYSSSSSPSRNRSRLHKSFNHYDWCETNPSAQEQLIYPSLSMPPISAGVALSDPGGMTNGIALPLSMLNLRRTWSTVSGMSATAGSNPHGSASLLTISNDVLEPQQLTIAATSSSSLEPAQDVIVTVGGQHFVHSSQILIYASPVLAEHLQPVVVDVPIPTSSSGAQVVSPTTTTTTIKKEHIAAGGGSNRRSHPSHHHHEHPSIQLSSSSSSTLSLSTTSSTAVGSTTTSSFLIYSLDFNHKDPLEWKLLQGFLEPPVRRKVMMTPTILPLLLPWLVELELTVLLQDIDDVLQSLQWPAPNRANSEDVSDLLLLIRICQVVHRHPMYYHHDPSTQKRLALPQTWTKAMQRFTMYIRERPELLGQNWTVLQDLVLLLQSPTPAHVATVDPLFSHDERLVLWPLITQILPPDLILPIDELIVNSLFPYLLRNGFEHASQKRQEHQRRQVQQKREEEARDVSSSSTSSLEYSPDRSRSSSMSSGSRASRSKNQSRSFESSSSRSRNKAVTLPPQESLQSSTAEAMADFQESFENWWWSWSIAQRQQQLAQNGRSEQLSLNLTSYAGNSTSSCGAGNEDLCTGQSNDQQSTVSKRYQADAKVKPITQRTNWLQLTWSKLQEPPLFPPDEMMQSSQSMAINAAYANIVDDDNDMPWVASNLPSSNYNTPRSTTSTSMPSSFPLQHRLQSNHTPQPQLPRRTFAC